jgi:hypothetical protein
MGNAVNNCSKWERVKGEFLAPQNGNTQVREKTPTKNPRYLRVWGVEH